MKKFRDVCRRYEDSKVFDSVGRGEAGPESDIDLLYELATGARLCWNIEAFADELSELLGRRVDLFWRDSLHEHLRERVLAEARSLYAA